MQRERTSRTISTRFLGLALIIVSAFAIWGLRQNVVASPHHEANAIELALAAVAILAGEGGGVLLIEGDALFRPYVPPAYRESGRD